MELGKHIAIRIRDLREGFGGEGISQEALAKRVGTTANTISRWETSTYKPSIADLEKLSRFFGVSVLAFFPAAEEQPLDEQVTALLRAAKQLRPDDVKELRRYAEFRKARSLYENGQRARPGRKETRQSTRYKYYEEMKALAREVRIEHDLLGPRVTRSDLRRIFRTCGIKFDLRSGFKSIRGAYFNDDCGSTIVVSKDLPEDPRVFTMAHELKHHLADRETIDFRCKFDNVGTDPIEIGAEVFSAELLFPEAEFVGLLGEMGVTEGSCTAEHLVRLKHNTRTTLSYQGLAKRAEFVHLAAPGAFTGVKFKKLEEQIFGKPFRRPRRNAPRK